MLLPVYASWNPNIFYVHINLKLTVSGLQRFIYFSWSYSKACCSFAKMTYSNRAFTTFAATPNHIAEGRDGYITREGTTDKQHQCVHGCRGCSAHNPRPPRYGQAHPRWQVNHHIQWWCYHHEAAWHHPSCRKNTSWHRQIPRFWGTTCILLLEESKF